MGTPQSDSAFYGGKPRLVCIEGVAGSGKTTLCSAIQQGVVERGRSIKYIPEFSSSSLGSWLAKTLDRSKIAGERMTPLDEYMLCMADRFASLTETPDNYHGYLLLADRGFITQAILSIPLMKHTADQDFAVRFLKLADDWLNNKFLVSTYVLELTFDQNLRRLEERLRRRCSDKEKETLFAEWKAYADLPEMEIAKSLRMERINGARSPDIIAGEIIDELLEGS